MQCPAVRAARPLMALAAAAVLRAGPAGAYRLNVVAASELQMEPEVRAGAPSLAVRVRLRDDRGASLARRPVALTFRAGGLADVERAVVTDANGAGATSVEVGAARVVRVEGRFVGDSTAAPARAAIDVDLDAPFVTPELVVPGEGVTFGGAPVEAVVTVRVGQVQAIAPGRLGVEVAQALDASGRRRALAAGETDATGRVVLSIPSARFEGVGAVRLVPRVDLGGGRVVEGVGRDLLVRGLTAVSLLRAARADDEGDGVTLHGALVIQSGAPVAGAAVRILRAERTVAAARTDAAGHFTVALGAESLGEPGVVVRAVFEPTEPWYVGSESPPLALTEPAPPPIRWTWAAVPLGLAALAIAWISLRRKPIALDPAPSPPPAADHLERLAAEAPAGVRVGFVAVDRSTGAVIAGARVRLGDGAWRRCDDAPFELGAARGAVAELDAEGFAPRAVTLEFPRPGAYRMQVALQTWREALFGRVRPVLDRARSGDGLPTPREAAHAAGAGPGVAALVTHVEAGCYGASAPDAEALRTADELARAARDDASSRVPDRR